MKKLSVFLLMILTVTFAGCNGSPPVTSGNYNNYTNSGNISNNGYAVKYKDNYLYANPADYDRLYVKNTATDTDEYLAGVKFYYNMNLYNDTIYFTDGAPGKIHKISPDGSGRKKLIRNNSDYLIVYDNHLYYRYAEEKNWGGFYRADLNGKNKKLLAKKVLSYCIHNDVIYYSDIGDYNALCSMNLDGTNHQIITNAETSNLLVQNGKLLYADSKRDFKLFSYDLENKVETCISEDKFTSYNCNDEKTFYVGSIKTPGLYCMNPDGTEKQKLADGYVSTIIILDDTVIYSRTDKYNELFGINYKKILNEI